ncbi:hypothetical protein [Capnocytophaga canis]|uniref:Lipoprotein n=1 Tax=Capnocytophaga canis TaxID=1848903 RepID=A0A3A1YF18_9FLAO|nr:hypothetical protein [Capnocytophaga canis]RIY36151.1 hypothetical protein CKY20_08405 [Capnocytophaga canis]
MIRKVILLLMVGLSVACTKNEKEIEKDDAPQQQNGIVVTRNNLNKALINVTITSLKNLTYDDVEVLCSRDPFNGGFTLTFIRKMKENEIINAEGKVTLDVTELFYGVSNLVLDGDNNMYVLLVDKKSEKRFDVYNQVRVRIKKGETYHIELMAEKKK